MAAFATLVRREVASFFYAPIAYVVGVAFLALNGLSFWALMKALSDPTLPSPPGAVLRSFFGGTMLHWLVVFALISLLSMRSVSEERRNGLWEALLTTRVSVVTVLLAKWFALLLFYVLLWLPTLGLICILNLYLPAGASMDYGPVLAAYMGVFGIGAALLAVGLAFSTATENQIVAAVGCFSVFLAWLMLSELGVLSSAISLREILSNAGRGELRLDNALVVLAIVVVSLSSAVALAAHGRHPVWPGWTRVALLAVISSSLVVLASRHNQSWDLSAGKVNTLQAETRRVLAGLEGPVQLTLIRPQEEVFDSVFDELSRLLLRMQEAQPLLTIDAIDPLAHPDRVARWSFDLAIRPEDFASGGAILVQHGARTRSVDLLAMATFSADDLGVGALAELRAESAIRAAIANVSDRRTKTLCSATGHGELQSTRENAPQATDHWSPIAARIEGDGVLLRELRGLSEDSLAPCDALLLMGPADAVSSDEVIALQGYRAQGGNLLVALRSRPVPGEVHRATPGLALLLGQAGVGVLPAAVVDPEAEVDLPLAWITYDGYGEHPIVRDFVQRRATIWQTPVALRAVGANVQVLVKGSDEAYAEHSLEALFRTSVSTKNTSDTGDSAVAVALEDSSGARLVVMGSAEAFSALWSERGIGGNERLFVSALQWTMGREAASANTEAVSPERLRLLMSRADLQRAFVWCVIVGPLFFALLGTFLWWWRRREA